MGDAAGVGASRKRLDQKGVRRPEDDMLVMAVMGSIKRNSLGLFFFKSSAWS